MNRYEILLSLVVIFSFSGKAETPSDTVQNNVPADSIKSTQLEEVEVEGANQWLEASKSVYIPSKHEKNSSVDATALLEHMSIPEIIVNPEGIVKTLAGDNVEMFIDGIQADGMELRGMKMTDVERVEYLISPSDPKFMGKRFVINFIMKQYSFGGYTKLYETLNWAPSIPPHEDFFAFSKFKTKKSTWNVWGEYTSYQNRPQGLVSTEIFRLPEGDVIRQSEATSTESNILTPNAGLQYLYNAAKFQTKQSVNYQYRGVSHLRNFSNLTFIPELFPTETSVSNNPNHTNSINYSGRYDFQLAHGWSISTSSSFKYNHTNNVSLYTAENLPTINNSTKSDSYSFSIFNVLSKQVKQNQRLSLCLSGYFDWAETQYLGNNPMINNIYSHNFQFGPSYSYNSSKLMLSCQLFGKLDWYKSGTHFHRSFEPDFYAYMRYAFNRKNSLSLTLHYHYNTPGSGSLSAHLSQINELLYEVGNPDLKGSSSATISLYYSFYPSNSFTSSFFVSYQPMFNPSVFEFTQLQDVPGVLRKSITASGASYNPVNFGLNLTWRPFRNLVLSLYPSVNYCKVNGGKYLEGYSYKELWQALVTCAARYYLKNFYFGASYQSPYSYLRTYGSKGTIPDNLKIEAGWGNGKWNLNVSVTNPYKKNWLTTEHYFTSPYFTIHSTNMGQMGHYSIGFQTVYTFGYGKQIQRGSGEQTPQNLKID